MIEVGDTNGFYIRSDGMFWAHAGDVVLKSVKRGESTVYPFEGRASNPSTDREGETLIQKGLDFTPFCEHGEFNWNHIPFAFIGVPTGRKAWMDNEGWMAEGEIIGNLPVMKSEIGVYTTDNIVAQHNAVVKAGHKRGLCLSVEGKVTKRSSCGRYVQKAQIYNIAMTFRPVNPSCSVNLLAKSLNNSLEIIESDNLYRAMSMDNARPYIKEDLEGEEDEDAKLTSKLIRHVMKKGVSLDEARKVVFKYLSTKYS